MTMTAPLDIPSPRFTTTDTSTHTPSQARAHPTGDSLSINVVLALVLAALIVVGFVAFGGDAAANGPLTPASTSSEVVDTIEIYVVQPGDTLWSIATAVSLPGEDVRPLVDHLKSVAGGSALDVGQRIVIDHATMRS